MKIESIVKRVERITSPPNKWLHRVAMVVLLALMFLTVGDVIGRYLVNRIPGFGPIPGTFELTEFMLAVVVLTSIGYAQVKGEHISIDMLVSKFPRRARAIIECVTNFLSMAMFVLVTWQSIRFAQLLFSEHDVSGVLRIPVYPFLIIAAIGTFMFCLAMLSSFVQSLKKLVKNEP